MRLALSCSCGDIESFLGQYSHFGAPVKDLSRFSALCRELGDPQNGLKYIHIVGTNGKGSVAEYCTSALASAGYTVGRFTSPYVTSVCERIAIASAGEEYEISCADFARLSSVVADAAERCGELEFSQFEIINAVAFLYYKEKRVDYVVLEAGIGGTLDSTNVIPQPECAVLTSIGLDHTKILGDTVEKIAWSKCGIIKGGCAVAAVGIPEGAMQVIRRRCEATGARLVVPDESGVRVLETGIHGSRFSYKGTEYRLRMAGKYQITNALTAIETLSSIGVPQEHIRAGLERAVLPARMELLSGGFLLDGGHNPQAAQAVRTALESFACAKPVGIIGMMNTKDSRAFLDVILPCLDTVIFCDGFSEGNIPAEQLEAVCKAGSAIFHDPAQAVKYAESIAAGRLIYCGGSFYFAAEVRKLLLGRA